MVDCFLRAKGGVIIKGGSGWKNVEFRYHFEPLNGRYHSKLLEAE